MIYANTKGSHQQTLHSIEIAARWYIGWVMLGIASSIGLGTGLHTFMLFLGPFVARTTITAAQCGNLDFDTQGAQRYYHFLTNDQALCATPVIKQDSISPYGK